MKHRKYCYTNFIKRIYIAIGAQKKEEASTAIGNTLSQTISVIVSLWIILRKQTGLTLKKQDFLHCNYYYC